VLGEGSLFQHITQAGANLEVRFVRFDHDLPICFTTFASDAFSHYRNYAQGLLHFQHPKAGYLPIHTLSTSEAVSLRDLGCEVVLAVLLGQLRPDDRANAKDFRFVWHFDPAHDRPVPLEGVQSLGEAILYFNEHGTQTKRYRTIRQTNAAILADMHVRAMIALLLVIKYNLRWTVGERIEFDLDRTGTAKQSADLGPAHLVFHHLARRLEREIESRPEGGTFTSQNVGTARAKLDYLHHFSRFVPISPVGAERPEVPTGKLLVLNVSIVPRSPVYDVGTQISADDDMLMRRPASDGQPELHVSMRAPWAMYDVQTGRQTREYHVLLAGSAPDDQPPSMRPVDSGDGPVQLPANSDVRKFLLDVSHVRGTATNSPFPNYKEFFKGTSTQTPTTP